MRARRILAAAAIVVAIALIREGNDYLQKEYPRRDFIASAHLTATLQ